MYIANKERYETMKYTRCGKSGLLLPAFSLGLWHNFGSNDSYDNMVDLLTTAFDLGITHFDLANNYGPYPGSAEENFGKVLKHELSPYLNQSRLRYVGRTLRRPRFKKIPYRKS